MDVINQIHNFKHGLKLCLEKGVPLYTMLSQEWMYGDGSFDDQEFICIKDILDKDPQMGIKYMSNLGLTPTEIAELVLLTHEDSLNFLHPKPTKHIYSNIGNLHEKYEVEMANIMKLDSILSTHRLTNILDIDIKKIFLEGNVRIKLDKAFKSNKDILEYMFDTQTLGKKNASHIYSVLFLNQSDHTMVQKVWKGANPIVLKGEKYKTMITYGYMSDRIIISPNDDVSDFNVYIDHKDINTDIQTQIAKINNLISGMTITKLNVKTISIVISLKLSVPWDENIFMDIILTDPRLRYHIAIPETNSIVQYIRGLPIVIMSSKWDPVKNKEYIRGIIRHVKDCILVKCRGSKSISDIFIVSVVLSYALSIYEQKYFETKAFYDDCDIPTINKFGDAAKGVKVCSPETAKRVSNVTDLRRELPELFINNYSRECPILPIMVSEGEARRIINTGGRVICYPYPTTMYSRYYTSPDKFYVGLKKNRLSNRDKFLYLVTCYTTDHMNRPGSETYKYYCGQNDEEKVKSENKPKIIGSLRHLEEEKMGPLPSALIGNLCIKNTYFRVGVNQGPSSFFASILYALNPTSFKSLSEQIDILRTKLSTEGLGVTRQETSSIPFDVVVETFKNAEKNLDGKYYYRYFEEMFCIDIILIDVTKSKGYNIYVPNDGKYLWEQKFDRGIIVFRNQTKLYHETKITYEPVVSSSGETLFTNDDELYSSLMDLKRSLILKPTVIPGKDAFLSHELDHPVELGKRRVKGQYVNKDGICVAVQWDDGTFQRCFSRPLWKIPMLEDQPWNPLKGHLSYMNDIRKRLGLEERFWRSSGDDIVYLPNRQTMENYRMWLYNTDR